MKLRERYNRLTLWNKVAFWGSIASIVGFIWCLLVFFQSTPSPGEPILEIVSRSPTSLFVRNAGTGVASDMQFYPALYALTKECRIHDRFIPSQWTWRLQKLAPGREADIPRSAYIRTNDFSEVEYTSMGYQGPFLAPVITYRGPASKHVVCDVFQFFGAEDPLLMAVPLSYAPGVRIHGEFDMLDRTLESIRRDLVLAF